MNKQLLEQHKNDYLLFSEGSFIAVKNLDSDGALQLADAAALLEPKNVLTHVCYGYYYLCKLELEKAKKFFNQALEVDPENETAKTLLGVTLSMIPNETENAEKTLMSMAKSKDNDVKALAEAGVGFIHEIVSPPTPAQIMKAKERKNK